MARVQGIVVLRALLCVVVGGTTVNIDMEKTIARVEEEFTSITVDQAILGHPAPIFPFTSARVATLLKGLSPGYLRFGGTSTDSAFYSNEPASHFSGTVTPDFRTMKSEDVDNFVSLTRMAGLRWLYEFNLQLRFGEQWSPVNAMQMLDYIVSKGYGDNIDFELGNEPDLYYRDTGWTSLNGSRIAGDYAILKNVLAKYAALQKSVLVGPDTAGVSQVFHDFVLKVNQTVRAATFHHYYFAGNTAKLSDYINPDHFSHFENEVKTALGMVAASPNPNLSVWIGETSDSYGGGTQNVTDRYVSGFLWLDKLGLASRYGIGVVMRQTFYGGAYALISDDLYPNPDYWLTYLHKTLTDRNVLNVGTNSETTDNALYWRPYQQQESTDNTLRVYAQCTKPSQRYTPGSVTVYALNVNTSVSKVLTFTGDLVKQKIDVYLMTPYGPDGLLSSYVALNGKRLMMPDDHTLPTLVPTTQEASAGVKLPPLTYGFFVFPNANAKACLA